jgi:hypothetical protein
MAYVFTYDNLKTNLTNYLQRTDPDIVYQIPVFIMLGQRRVARELKILGMRVVINDVLTAGNPLLRKPNRWFNTSTFNIGTGSGYATIVNLPLRTYEYCNIYWQNRAIEAQPKYLADYDFNTWYLAPTPDEDYPCEYAIFQVPELIDETISTNFMTQSCPDVLVYACLLESAPYLKDDDRVPVWQNMYNLAKDALNKEDFQRLYDNYSRNRGAA